MTKTFSVTIEFTTPPAFATTYEGDCKEAAIIHAIRAARANGFRGDVRKTKAIEVPATTQEIEA